MAAVTICSDFRAPQNKLSLSITSPSISHEVMEPDAVVLIFWMFISVVRVLFAKEGQDWFKDPDVLISCVCRNKCHISVGFNNKNVLSHSLGGQKSKTTVSAELYFSEGYEGELAPCISPGFGGFAWNLWCAVVCVRVSSGFTWHFLCVFVSVSKFSLFIKT